MVTKSTRLGSLTINAWLYPCSMMLVMWLQVDIARADVVMNADGLNGKDVKSEISYLQQLKMHPNADMKSKAREIFGRLAEFKSMPEKLDLGTDDGAIWFTFGITNEANFDQRIFIEMPRQYFWIARLFIPVDDGVEEASVTGLEVTKSGEMVHAAESTLTVKIPRNASVKILMYGETDGPIDLTTRIYTSEPYLRHSFRTNNLNGIFFGVLICLIIYNFYNLVAFRTLNHLNFIMASSSVMLLFSTVNGVGINVLWPAAGSWNRDLLHLFAAFFVLFSLRTFLASVDNKELPRFDHWLSRCGIWLGMIMLTGPVLMPYIVSGTRGLAINITLLLNVVVMAIIPTLALRSWRRGFRPSLFMAIAFVPYGFSTLMRTLAQSGVGSEFFLENQPHQLAAALAMILTSMSMADHMSYLRARQVAEADAMRLRNAALIEQQKLTTKEQEATIRVAQMLAHDVRKPFSIMRIGLDMIARSRDHDEVKKYLSKLLPEVEAASGAVDLLIRDVMDIGSDAADDGRAPTGIESLIKDTLDQAFLMFPRVNVTAEFELHHTTMVFVNKEKIMRVMSNIYVNAIQALGYEGRTWFRTRDVIIDKKPYVEMCIGNAGSFIPEHNIKRIFDVFFTTGKKNGTGLGLAVARKIVSECGGQICCDSVKSEEFPLGKVEFFITLPTAVGHPERRGLKLPGRSMNFEPDILKVNRDDELHHAIADNHGHLETQLAQVSHKIGRSLRILIIDDDDFYRSSLKKFFDYPRNLQNQLTISEADGSEAALLLAEKVEFDLVICDINLGLSPLNGFEVVKKLRNDLPFAVLCLHSNRIVQSDHKFAVKMGADIYLPKPMSRGQMLRLALQASDSFINNRGRHIASDKTIFKPAAQAGVPTVVVVDDSPFVLDAWAAQLASEAELHLLPNFETLMERIRLEPNYLADIRCLIVDLYIDGSDLNGLEMARMIKKIRPNLMVILSSDAMVKTQDLRGAIDRVIGKEPQSLDKLGLVA